MGINLGVFSIELAMDMYTEEWDFEYTEDIDEYMYISQDPEDEVEQENLPLDEILVAAGAGQIQQGWEMLPDPPNFQFVEVESFLLDCVKDELKEIRKRTIDAFRKKYPQKSFSQMTASQLSVVWVTPYLNTTL